MFSSIDQIELTNNIMQFTFRQDEKKSREAGIKKFIFNLFKGELL